MSKSSKIMAPKAHRPRAERSPPEPISRGWGVVDEQSVPDVATAKEEKLAFMGAVVEGLADLGAGREHPLAEAKARLKFT